MSDFTTTPYTTEPWMKEPFTTNPWVAEDDNAFHFTNTGETLSPLITVTGSPDILWSWSDGTTDTKADPDDVTCVGENSLDVSDWDAVTELRFNSQHLTGELVTKDWVNATFIWFSSNNYSGQLQTKAWESATQLYFGINDFNGVFQLWPWVMVKHLVCSGDAFSSFAGNFQTQIAMTVCDFRNNAITSYTQIDKALSDLVVNAEDPGRTATCDVDFSGGTNSGPSSAGTADRNILVNEHNWTVTLEPEV